MKKLQLRLETLEVESFRTAEAGRGTGTVHGHKPGCTCYDSCLCPTAYYHCGTGPQTIHSCDYTYNDSCVRTRIDCPDTSFEQCATPPITPAC
jgi:hypothetical protein